jgi:hypothetical protein
VTCAILPWTWHPSVTIEHSVTKTIMLHILVQCRQGCHRKNIQLSTVVITAPLSSWTVIHCLNMMLTIFQRQCANSGNTLNLSLMYLIYSMPSIVKEWSQALPLEREQRQKYVARKLSPQTFHQSVLKFVVIIACPHACLSTKQIRWKSHDAKSWI